VAQEAHLSKWTRRLNPSHKPGREHPINFLPKIRKVNE
jgi:acetolactate synthase I/II/III large subunit